VTSKIEDRSFNRKVFSFEDLSSITMLLNNDLFPYALGTEFIRQITSGISFCSSAVQDR